MPAPNSNKKPARPKVAEAKEPEYIRARDEEGQFVPDDPSTPEVNEAFDPPKPRPKYQVIRKSVTERQAKLKPGKPNPQRRGAFGNVYTYGPPNQK